MAGIPSYQYHPKFLPGVVPSPSQEAPSTTAFALFEALWEVRILLLLGSRVFDAGDLVELYSALLTQSCVLFDS